MGVMVNGEWHQDDVSATNADGEWKRKATSFHDWITVDGSPGLDGQDAFAAEPARYHLYAAYNCPWAHRTLLYRRLKNLDEIVSVSYVLPKRSDQGWVFDPESALFDDSILGSSSLWEVYRAADEDYTGRVTVPVLWDKEAQSIVNNESSEIIRIFNTAFEGIAEPSPDYYPEGHRDEIDRINERVYNTVNNGVYKAGFARTQEAYEKAFDALFESLDWLEERLAERRFLVGDELTEADIRLFPTLARFDVAYHYAFKCNLRRLVDYPNLWRYAREIYHHRDVRETVDFDVYRRGYHSKSELRNPLGIVPKGPQIDWGL